MTSLGAVRSRLVWQTRPIHDAPRPDDWAWLTEADLARAARITHPSAMTRFVTARALLRELLSVVRPDLDPARLRIETEPSGRPYVAEQPHLHVSISHTNGLAAAAVAGAGPIGIDVERLDRDDLPSPSVWLAPAELPQLRRIDVELRRLALLHRWVAKEAAIKAHPFPQQAERRRIALICAEGHTAAEPPSVRTSARTEVRMELGGAGTDRRPSPAGGPGHPAPGTHTPPVGPDDRRAVSGSERGIEPAGGTDRRSAPAHDVPPSDPPSDAFWCGSGRARLELAATTAVGDPARVDAGDSTERWLSIDWYALADQYLVAVARPPEDPRSAPELSTTDLPGRPTADRAGRSADNGSPGR